MGYRELEERFADAVIAPIGWCCAALEEAVTFDCDRHANGHDCPDVLVVPNFAEGGLALPVRDGGTSFVMINYCPWCGADIRAG